MRDARPDLDIALCQGSGMPPGRHVDYRAYDDQTALLKEPNAPPLTAASFTLGDPPGPRVTVHADPGTLLQVYRWWDGTEGGRYTLEWMYRKQKLMTGEMWTTKFGVEVEGLPDDG